VSRLLSWGRSAGEGRGVFEFHGWATIRVPDPNIDVSRRHELEAVAIPQLREAIARADDQFSLFDVRQTGNELIVLYAHGLRNHRFRPVIELFRWVADELPESYGLLYAYDDEVEGRDNEFRVWRLAGGRLEELADPFLSPRIPTVDLVPPYSCDVLIPWLSLLDNLRANHVEAVMGDLAGFLSREQASFLLRLAERALEAQDAEPGAVADRPRE
jgi:Immunity protein 7